MLFSENAQTLMKSRIMQFIATFTVCQSASFRRSKKGKQNYFSLLMTAKVVVSYTYHRVPNKERFCLNSLHAEQRFFFS